MDEMLPELLSKVDQALKLIFPEFLDPYWRWIVAAIVIYLLLQKVSRTPIRYKLLFLYKNLRFNRKLQEEVAVYEWYSDKYPSIYIGKSNHPPRRTQEHFPKVWVRQAQNLRIIDWYPNDQIARQVEERLIKERHPIVNKVHNSRRRVRR